MSPSSSHVCVLHLHRPATCESKPTSKICVLLVAVDPNRRTLTCRTIWLCICNVMLIPSFFFLHAANLVYGILSARPVVSTGPVALQSFTLQPSTNRPPTSDLYLLPATTKPTKCRGCCCASRVPEVSRELAGTLSTCPETALFPKHPSQRPLCLRVDLGKDVLEKVAGKARALLVGF